MEAGEDPTQPQPHSGTEPSCPIRGSLLNYCKRHMWLSSLFEKHVKKDVKQDSTRCQENNWLKKTHT